MIRNSTCTKPILDVILETARPNLDQLPESRLIRVDCIESLDISHGWLVASKDVDVPLLDGHCCRQVPIPVELRLLTPTIIFNRVHLASFRSVIEARADCVNV